MDDYEKSNPQYQCPMVGPNGETFAAAITTWSPSQTKFCIRLEAEGIDALVSEEGSLLEALRSLRQSLESQGLSILCNGARENAVQSAMLAQSGRAGVYLIEIGKPASGIVPMFDPCDQSLIATVEQSDQFREKLIASLNS